MVQPHTSTYTNSPSPITNSPQLQPRSCVLLKTRSGLESCASTTKQNRLQFDRASQFERSEKSSLDHSEGHCKTVVVSSSMLRQWMVDWTMGKFTYTIDQDTIHRRYEQHISTTTLSLKLTIIDENCLKHTNPVIFNYFCSHRRWRIFV